MNDDDHPIRTLVVYCPDWPLVAAGRGDTSGASTQPAAVLFANRVLSTNHAARAEGVEVGLRRREAQGRCPSLEVLPHDPARDARVFEAVAAALSTLTPRVEITEPGVCSFATRGPSRYHGGDADLARLAAERATAAAGVAVLVGVADGPLVARLAAAHAGSGLPRVVPPGKAADFLAPLPLRSLAHLVGDGDVLDTLARLGVRTLGDVGAFPAASLLGRFGWQGAWLHRLACGLDPQVLHLADPPPEVTVAHDLDPPAQRADAVAFVARTLAAELVDGLGGRGLACRQVVVTLHTDHGEIHERCWRLDGPVTSTVSAGGAAGRDATAVRSVVQVIAERVRWQVDGWLSGPVGARPTAGVCRVVLAPATVEPARGRQLGFWGGEAGAGERVVRAVAHLEALLGAEAVRVPEVRGGRQAHEAVSLVTAGSVDLTVRRTVVPGGHEGGGALAPWPGRLPAPAPTVLHDPPLLIDVLDERGVSVEVTGRGEVRSGPAVLEIGHRRAAIVGWAGPWPLEERWWDRSSAHRRARLQVVTTDGSAYLLGRAGGRWWLDATYA